MASRHTHTSSVKDDARSTQSEHDARTNPTLVSTAKRESDSQATVEPDRTLVCTMCGLKSCWQ